MKYIIVLTLLIGCLFSCGDDDSEETFDYSVTIMSPDNEDKNSGDSIHVHVNFDESNSKTIHNISVEITDLDGTEVYRVSEHVHEESGHYEHHADVALNVMTGSTLTLKASVWPQHSTEENEQSEEEHGHEEEAHDSDSKVTSEVTFRVN